MHEQLIAFLYLFLKRIVVEITDAHCPEHSKRNILRFQKLQPTAAKILEKDAIADEMHQFLGKCNLMAHVYNNQSTNPCIFNLQ